MCTKETAVSHRHTQIDAMLSVCLFVMVEFGLQFTTFYFLRVYLFRLGFSLFKAIN